MHILIRQDYQMRILDDSLTLSYVDGGQEVRIEFANLTLLGDHLISLLSVYGDEVARLVQNAEKREAR